MKELSTEEKAKRYEEAIAMAKECITHIPDEAVNKYMLNMFPELKDPEDKKIKEALIALVKCNERCGYSLFNNVSTSSMLAWIEKQGEQKSADKVEPKFKVGDWIIFNGLTIYINEVVKGYYRTISKDGIPNSYDWDIDNAARLWTIEDAKDGDVLVASDDSVFIFARVDGYGCVHHIALANDGVLKINPRLTYAWESVRGVKIATKEQHDQLEKAILKAGYKWDANKRELIKL